MKEVEVNNIQKKSRLRKRQAGYAKNITAFANVRPGQAFYEEKHALMESLQTLNNSIQDKDESLDVEKMTTLRALYADSISKLDQLNRAINSKIGMYKKNRNVEEEEPSGKERKLTSEAMQNDLLANTLSKDLNAFDAAIKKGEKKTLSEIYESSRTVTYGVKKGSVLQNASGNQNSRIPLTIIDGEGHEVEGFFTPDKSNDKSKSLDDVVEDAIKKSIKKHGKAGSSLVSASKAKNIYDYISGNKEIYSILLSYHKEYSLANTEKMRKVISKMDEESPVDMRALLNTREKYNTFLNIMHDAAMADNARSLLDEVDLADSGRLNRRNTAMSKMAEILGVPNIIAKSDNVKIKLGGKEFKGTFMKKADGADEKKYYKEPLFMEATFESAENLKLKKCVADLQVLDYICGNPDRHAANVMYNFKRRKDGTVVLDSIQGIDNDLSFGATDFETGVKMKAAVKLGQMKVITRSMADRVMNLTPDSLKQIFYGYELTAEEIKNMETRLKDLQNKIKKDNLEFGKGYGKGALIPGTIKVVEDDELEFMSFNDDLSMNGKKENLFNKVRRRTDGFTNIEKAKNQLIDDYKSDVYDATIGSFPSIEKIYKDIDSDTVMLQGDQNKYNIMLRNIKELKEAMLSYKDPDCEKMSGQGETSQNLKDLVEKTRNALKEVNNYIYYKDSKKTGEDWRNDPNLNNPNRKPGKTERRYKHAIDAREALSKQMDVLMKLEEKAKQIGDYKNKERSMMEKVNKNMKLSEGYVDAFNSVRDENRYQTHKSRCEYELYEIHFDAVGARHDGNGAREFMANLRFDAGIGFAINSLRPEDRPALRDKMSQITGKKFEADEDLLKRSFATILVTSKLALMEKNKKYMLDKAEQSYLEHMQDIKLDNPKNYVSDLMNSNEFKRFFEENREDINYYLKSDKPEIGMPEKPEMGRIIRTFGLTCLDLHPERKAAKEAQKNKNKDNNHKALQNGKK